MCLVLMDKLDDVGMMALLEDTDLSLQNCDLIGG
jgi:hypothetical protein